MIKVYGKELDFDTKETLIVAYFVNGLVCCLSCKNLLVINIEFGSTPIFVNNILPYSQICWICKTIIVEAAKDRNGNLLIAFDFKYV